MTKCTYVRDMEQLIPRFSGTPRQLEIVLGIVTNCDPIENNPAVTVSYRCPVIRPDEYAAAEFAWQGLITRYKIAPKDVHILYRSQRIFMWHLMQYMHSEDVKTRCEIEKN